MERKLLVNRLRRLLSNLTLKRVAKVPLGSWSGSSRRTAWATHDYILKHIPRHKKGWCTTANRRSRQKGKPPRDAVVHVDEISKRMRVLRPTSVCVMFGLEVTHNIAIHTGNQGCHCDSTEVLTQETDRTITHQNLRTAYVIRIQSRSVLELFRRIRFRIGTIDGTRTGTS